MGIISLQKQQYMHQIKLLVFALFLIVNASCAQQRRYVSYKVKEGETMKSIAQRLDVRTKDLMKLNPDVSKKPSANTIIIIPNPKLGQSSGNFTEVDETTKIDNADATNTLTEEENALGEKIEKITYEYETHTVLPKETVYAITKKYGITKEELIALNPEFPGIRDNNLSIGQVVKVKSQEIKTYITLEEEYKNYVTHTVKPKETVYGLTRFYNITKDQLIQLNPEFPEIVNNYLQIDQILKIRKIEEKLDTDDVAFYQDTLDYSSHIKLAFLLPFKAKQYDSVDARDIFKNNLLTNYVTDFYLGAEIAIDSLVQQGVSVNTKVLDTGNKGKNIPTILNSGELDDVDAIIGPFYSSKAEVVANKAKAPVIYPHFSNNQHKFSAAKLIKAEPDLDYHSTFLANYLNDIYNDETIFIVGDGASDSDNQVQNLVTELRKNDSIQKVHILKPKDGYIKKERFTEHMQAKSHCWVILTSDDKVAIADALNSMVVLPEDVTVQVFAIRKGKAYDEVNNNKLARIDFAYVTSHFTDLRAATTKAFNRKYKDKNYAIPSNYATKGFDITYDILMRLASGKKLNETFKEGASLRLESKFDFDKKLLKPTSNKGLFLIKYNKDLSLERLK